MADEMDSSSVAKNTEKELLAMARRILQDKNIIWAKSYYLAITHIYYIILIGGLCFVTACIFKKWFKNLLYCARKTAIGVLLMAAFRLCLASKNVHSISIDTLVEMKNAHANPLLIYRLDMFALELLILTGCAHVVIRESLATKKIAMMISITNIMFSALVFSTLYTVNAPLIPMGYLYLIYCLILICAITNLFIITTPLDKSVNRRNRKVNYAIRTDTLVYKTPEWINALQRLQMRAHELMEVGEIIIDDIQRQVPQFVPVKLLGSIQVS